MSASGQRSVALFELSSQKSRVSSTAGCVASAAERSDQSRHRGGGRWQRDFLARNALRECRQDVGRSRFRATWCRQRSRAATAPGSRHRRGRRHRRRSTPRSGRPGPSARQRCRAPPPAARRFATPRSREANARRVASNSPGRRDVLLPGSRSVDKLEAQRVMVVGQRGEHGPDVVDADSRIEAQDQRHPPTARLLHTRVRGRTRCSAEAAGCASPSAVSPTRRPRTSHRRVPPGSASVGFP